MKYKLFVFLLSVIPFFLNCSVSFSFDKRIPKGISPFDYGLLQAKTGGERYYVLLRTHIIANQEGVPVDYHNVGVLDITVPQGAESIPLGSVNNFEGTIFNVTNNSQNTYLFTLKNEAYDVIVSSSEIDKGNYKNTKELSMGKKILVIEDNNLWVNNRVGYEYGHSRKDIQLIINGLAKNNIICPYNNTASAPKSKYYDVDKVACEISNVTFNRSENNRFKTYLCYVEGVNDVVLKNVVINTPTSDLTDDVAINIINSTNVSFEKVIINGTYSKSNHSGYGICMNNIWNYTADSIKCVANWGVFGTNNINHATIKNSEINRFDIHCYGKDVYFENVLFTKLYNQFSSIYGTILFKKCVFDDFIPVLYEPSYNIYNEHKVVFDDCNFFYNSSRNFLLYYSAIPNIVFDREELKKKVLPTVSIKNLNVIVPDDGKEFSIFYFDKKSEADIKVDETMPITVKGMKFIDSESNEKAANIRISNMGLQTNHSSRIKLKKVLLNPQGKSLGSGKVIINIKDNERAIRYRVSDSMITTIER